MVLPRRVRPRERHVARLQRQRQHSDAVGLRLAESRGAGHGAANEVLALSGTTSSVVAFGPVIQSNFTVCSRSRGTLGARCIGF